jgi:polysaccharide chain length determinant protein (PEP-CTERM system associated)
MLDVISSRYDGLGNFTMAQEPAWQALQADESEIDLNAVLSRITAGAIRRRWWIGCTAGLIALGTIAVSFYLPNKYKSEATIFAVQQRIPERYVVPTSTTDPGQALEAMVQEVLSRPRLLAVINELRLYAAEKQTLAPDELLQLVRLDLSIEPIESMLGSGGVNAFKISFVAERPQLAQAVTQRLTTLFIEQNLKTRAERAETTTEFLHEQLEVARTDLQQQEQRLRDFKMQYLGELPEQQQGNLGILGSLQSQLDNVMASRSQAQQQRLYLESLLGEYQRRERRSTPLRSSTGEVLTPLQAAESDLIRLQSEKKNLLSVYTARHPDVQTKEKEILLQQNLIERLKSAKPITSDSQQVSGNNELPGSEQDMMIAQIKSQLQANRLEIDNLGSKEQKLRGEVELYQSRLNLTPVREQQLASMQRDYELLKQHYGELLKKQQESQLATDLEKRQEGQQFRLADPPNLPTVPSSPKRVRISLIGLLGGIVAGCGLAFLIEFKDSSLRGEDDARKRLAFPLVVAVPLLLTPAEERSRTRKRVLEWVAACVLISFVAVANLYVFKNG